METLKTFLNRKKLQPADISKETGVAIGIITGLIDGNLNIMDIDLGTVLLLCQSIGASLTDLIGYSAIPERDWQISIEQSMYYLSFKIGSRKFKLELCPATEANSKYIKTIAQVDYEGFLHAILENKSAVADMDIAEEVRYEKFISDITKEASIYLSPIDYTKNDWRTVKQRFDIRLMGIPLITGLPLSGTAEIDIPWGLIDPAMEEDEEIVRGILLSYRGLSASARYDDKEKIYHGKLEDISDLVTFGGATIKEATEDFKTAVDDYLADEE